MTEPIQGFDPLAPLCLYVAVLTALLNYVRFRKLAKASYRSVTLKGAKSSLKIAALFVTGTIGAGFMSAQLSLQYFTEIFCLGMFIFGFTSVSLFLAFSFIEKRKSGEILLDCGVHPAGAGFAFCGGFIAMIGLYGSTSFKSWQKIVFDYSSFFLCILVSLVCYFVSSARLQLRREGIWQYWRLRQWQNIHGFRWEEDDGLQLVIKLKKGVEPLSHTILLVPPDRKQDIDRILRQHHVIEM